MLQWNLAKVTKSKGTKQLFLKKVLFHIGNRNNYSPVLAPLFMSRNERREPSLSALRDVERYYNNKKCQGTGKGVLT